MCAGSELNKNNCVGDGGSPLTVSYVGQGTVVGTLSYGPKDCASIRSVHGATNFFILLPANNNSVFACCSYGSAFTHIGKVMPWILKNIKSGECD